MFSRVFSISPLFKNKFVIRFIFVLFISILNSFALQDKWLLHSVLMLVQSWIEPLVYLQTTLNRYDGVPDMLLNKTKWVSDKLMSLEQGVVVLIKKVGPVDKCAKVSKVNVELYIYLHKCLRCI